MTLPEPSWTLPYVSPKRRGNPAGVAREVLRVDADEDDAARLPSPRGRLDGARLVLARLAPRRPEVEDDDATAKRRELQLAVPADAVEVEVGSGRLLARCNGRGDGGAALRGRDVHDE